MKRALVVLLILVLCGCTSWRYRTEEEKVFFSIRSWNHDPLDYEVNGADVSSFRSLRDGYAKDRHRVYLKGDVICGADPATFEILRDGYSKDSARVFLGRCVLPDADPKTWVLLGDYWSRDARSVFHAQRVIPGAQPETFRYLGNSWALDGRRAFHHLPLYTEDCDGPDQLRLSIFDDVDPESFVVVESFKAKDSRREYDALRRPIHPAQTTPGS